MKRAIFRIEGAATRALVWSIALAIGMAMTLVVVSLAIASPVMDRRVPQAPHTAPPVPSAVYIYTSTGQTMAIPPNGCISNVYVTQSITVSDDFKIGRARVGINLNHTQRGNLRIRLIAPDQTGAWLIYYPHPITPTQNLDVMLDDRSPFALEGGGGDGDHDTLPPFYDYTWQPYEPLAAFKGKNSTGVWSLLVCDKTNGDLGNTNFFSLWLDPNAPDFVGSAKSVQSSLYAPGDSINYDIVINNSGTDKAVGAVMVDHLPPGMTLDSVNTTASIGQVSYAGSVVSWTGALLPGVAAIVDVPVTVDTCVSSLTNTAVISDASAARSIQVDASPEEGFESGDFPPLNWILDVVPGTTATWNRVTSGNNPSIGPFRGTAMAEFNSYSATQGDAARLDTRALYIPSDYRATFTFMMYHDAQFSARHDRIQVQISIDGGATFVDLQDGNFPRYDGITSTWQLHSIDLLGYSGQNNLVIGFLGISDLGNNIYIDDVSIQYVPLSGGFTFAPQTPLISQTMTFTGSTIGQTDLFTKTWDFGDGTMPQYGNPVTHTFYTSRTYTITMSVCGFVAVSAIPISSKPVPANVSVESSSPTLLRSPTYFTATLRAGSLPITYTWDFGDGTQITGGPTTVHTYTAPGRYTTSLSATNGAGSVIATVQVAVQPVADLAVTQSAGPPPLRVGRVMTYTLAVNNNGPALSTGVLLTDTLPAGTVMQIRSVTTSQGICTQKANVVTCALGSLSSPGVIKVDLQVLPLSAVSATNHVALSGAALDPDLSNNSSDMTLPIDRAKLSLPVVLYVYPAIPDTPVLNPVNNPFDNGNYTVSWNAVNLGITYTLQEATNVNFTNAVTVYVGTGTSWDAIGKPPNTYYYRVKASSATAESAWSNIQSVTFSLHFDGNWSGTTSQNNRAISFSVAQNAFMTLSISYNVAGCEYYSQQFFVPPVGITGNSFRLERDEATYAYVVTGTFTSATTAVGGLSIMSWDNTGIPPCVGMATATWTATRK